MRKSIEDFRKNCGMDKGKGLSVDYLIDLAKIILDNNYFEFSEKVYKQKLGTAIGTKFPPAFANIFMAELENKMLAGYHLSPSVWFRFLDDIFFICLHGKESLLEFLNYINNYHETIKYTWEYSERGVSYLDVRVELESGKLQTDVYSKPTDTHQYLDFKSCHPAHVKKAIPYAWSGGKIKTDL
jgi:hypothetical protein